MAVISHEARLVYVPVPKIACTSVKTMFYELANPDGPRLGLRGRLRAALGGAPRPLRIHHQPGYATLRFTRVAAAVGPIPQGYVKVALVRDPLARLRSAWGNKVGRAIFAARGEIEDVENEELPLDPSFSQFLRGFEGYRRVSRAARAHTEPLRWHLGPDLGWYDHVFRMEDMDAFAAFVSERVGRPVRPPRKNEGGAPSRPATLEPGDEDRLRALLSDDYALLDGVYDVERALAAVARRAA